MRLGSASSQRFSSQAGPRKRHSRARASLLFYMIGALILLTLERFDSQVPIWVRGVANDVVAPVLGLVDQPIRSVQNSIERIAGVSDIYIENEALRRENRRLNQWRDAAAQLGRENDQLRSLMKAPGQTVPAAAAVRVVGVGGGAFEKSVLVNAGLSEGLSRGWPVVDDYGLVGRVMEIGQFSSRVLLISDLNSRIPVRIERSGQLAIVMGNNEDWLTLKFLPESQDVEVGDRILTSGHGGVFPPDILVAVVASVDEGTVRLTPSAKLSRLDYLKILAYQTIPPEVQRDMEVPE